jgi:hypothetical protein
VTSERIDSLRQAAAELRGQARLYILSADHLEEIIARLEGNGAAPVKPAPAEKTEKAAGGGRSPGEEVHHRGLGAPAPRETPEGRLSGDHHDAA